MKNIKNLRVVAASLCLSATLLTGCDCDARIDVGKSSIEYDYDKNKITGNITFEDLNEYGKIVVLEDNGENFTRLLIKEEGHYDGGSSESIVYDYIIYKDLETGATMLYYKNYTNTDMEVWEKGKDLEIISEVGINSYLVNNNFVKTDYTVEEIMTFYYDTVLPSLDLNEKELVK